MDRPKLTLADLEEVDRLLRLAGVCDVSHMGATCHPEIKDNAIRRAADILGVNPSVPLDPTVGSMSDAQHAAHQALKVDTQPPDDDTEVKEAIESKKFGDDKK